MARSELLRKIREDFPASFVLAEVRAETRHSSYAKPLASMRL